MLPLLIPLRYLAVAGQMATILFVAMRQGLALATLSALFCSGLMRWHMTTLAGIARYGGADTPRPQPAGLFVLDCCGRWRPLRPNVPASIRVDAGERRVRERG